MWNCEWITTGWPNIEQYPLEFHQETNFFKHEFAKGSLNIDFCESNCFKSLTNVKFNFCIQTYNITIGHSADYRTNYVHFL